jgi:tetratricopeptide (TPR) repeat protein
LFVGVANTIDEEMNITGVKNDTTKNTAHIRAILQFVNSMEAENENGLHFNWNYYENDNHGSVPLIATYDALRFLFPWYELKGLNQFSDESTTASADDLIHLIDTHYTTFSSNFGYEVLPPESFINTLGYDLMYNPRAQNSAKALFNMNVKNYPTSSNAYDSMGDFYLAQQDSIKALELFKKALEVADNDFSQEKIDLLKKNLKIE